MHPANIQLPREGHWDQETLWPWEIWRGGRDGKELFHSDGLSPAEGGQEEHHLPHPLPAIRHGMAVCQDPQGRIIYFASLPIYLFHYLSIYLSVYLSMSRVLVRSKAPLWITLSVSK